jgi:hypothetical protein
VVEGLGRPGVGEGRRRWSMLDGMVVRAWGEERGAEMSTVEMAKGVAPFYRVGGAGRRPTG